MNKKISLGAAVAFALIVAAAVFSMTMDFAKKDANKMLISLQEREQFYSKFSEVDHEVRQRYYGVIDEKALQDGMARGFLSGLGDPHAAYYTAEEYAQKKEKSNDESATIGVKVKSGADGYLEVTEVYPESPAAISGIRVGSLIIEIDEQQVTTANTEQMRLLVEGPEGSKVNLTTRTDGEDQFHPLVRRLVVTPTVTWEMLPESTIAYVRISSFDKNSSNQFNRVLKEIQEQGGQSLIFDLRGNQSVELATAPRILDRLVPAEPTAEMILVAYQNGTSEVLEMSDSNSLAWPMAVLVNSQTSGAPEIFAQVLMDYDKAKTVGTTTAGKGILLQEVPLSDGSAIELTVAKYQSGVSGTSFDGEGLKPDYDVSLPNVEDDQWMSVARDKDTQLIKAIELVSVSSG